MPRATRKLFDLIYDDNPILRKKCRQLTKTEILTPKIQNLIDDIKYTCDQKKYGVGISANQIGKPLAISVIAIKPTPNRPNLTVFDTVCINTKIIETFGEKQPMWEGCQSTIDETGEPVFAQVPRYQKIRIQYLDRNGTKRDEVVEDFVAHVIQHETDHLNGILFTDHIDKSSLISAEEYRKLTTK